MRHIAAIHVGTRRRSRGCGVNSSLRFRQPLVVDATGAIVCGHTRYEASKLLGLTTVPCVLADDLSPDAIRAYRLLDNKLHEKSEWDYPALEAELAGFEYDFSAFDVSFDPPDFLEEAPAPPIDDSEDAPPSAFELVVKCDDEEDQRALYERLVEEGYRVRVCNL